MPCIMLPSPAASGPTSLSMRCWTSIAAACWGEDEGRHGCPPSRTWVSSCPSYPPRAPIPPSRGSASSPACPRSSARSSASWRGSRCGCSTASCPPSGWTSRRARPQRDSSPPARLTALPSSPATSSRHSTPSQTIGASESSKVSVTHAVLVRTCSSGIPLDAGERVPPSLCPSAASRGTHRLASRCAAEVIAVYVAPEDDWATPPAVAALERELPRAVFVALPGDVVHGFCVSKQQSAVVADAVAARLVQSAAVLAQ